MKDFFKPKDFLDTKGCQSYPVETIASIANEKLNALIESWPVVYGYDLAAENPTSRNIFFGKKEFDSSHKARLAFIEELPKKECVHKPIEFQDHVGSLAINPVCRYCNAELKAVWSKK